MNINFNDINNKITTNYTNNKNGNKNKDSHIIQLNKYILIDTKKLKRYLKVSFKFAFSQIGLVGLVVGYVILGALIFMKIESSYEKV